MKRELWPDAQIEIAIKSISGPGNPDGWDDVVLDVDAQEFAMQVRDDLTRRLISTQRAAWRVLRANAELRERVAELETENTRLREHNHDQQVCLALANKWCAEYAHKLMELAEASQAEREWIPVGERLPEPLVEVELRIMTRGKTRRYPTIGGTDDWIFTQESPSFAWRPLPAQGQGEGEKER